MKSLAGLKPKSPWALLRGNRVIISDEQTLHVGSKFKGRNPFGVRSTGSYLVIVLNNTKPEENEE